MRKCLLFVALIMLHANLLKAQSLFKAPDTVCPKQAVQLLSNVPDAKSHYWGFCSGYIFNDPVGKGLGKTSIGGPTAIEIEKDGDNYYAFVLNKNYGGLPPTFLRLEYGKSLDSTPKITNYGNIDGVLPFNPNALHIIKDETKGVWHLFIVGGTDATNSSIARLDFGSSLGNTPNVVNFGNYRNILNNPVGLFINREDNLWYGYTFNKPTNTLVRFDFDSLLSLTPTSAEVGFLPGLNSPNDYCVIKDNGVWHFFVTNEVSNNLVRLDFGAKLAGSIPTVSVIGDLGGLLENPYGISLIRDCDSFHMFIVNRRSNDFVRVDMTSITGTLTPNNFGSLGLLVSGPTGLTRPIRDRDNIYLFSTNDADSNLVRIKFQQCDNASIQSSTTMNPPLYTYDTAGTYNIYYLVNEGLPDMQVECKIITVLPTPDIFMSNDTTICKGDTIGLRLISVNAINQTWSPNYNIDNTTKQDVAVWPEYSTNYHILLPFNSGCIIDTVIKVRVNKVDADAGPDRMLADGASTILGGPRTSNGINYSYLWTPDRYLSNNNYMNPVAEPPHDFSYYLTVRDNNSGCVAVDSVTVRVGCNAVNLPNAFYPLGNAFQNRFGLKNSQIVRLVRFSIYDRWGTEVFAAQGSDGNLDPTAEWDGTINGGPAAMGVYVWVVEGFCANGKRLKDSGNVTLIR